MYIQQYQVLHTIVDRNKHIMDNKTRLSNDKHFSIIYLHFNSAAFQNVPIKPTVKQYNACYQFTIIAPALNFGHRGAIQVQPRYLVVLKEMQSPLVITNYHPHR
jgi:ssDNA-specific exonuclease RecJ